jgi:Cytochrome c554 and c-prime
MVVAIGRWAPTLAGVAALGLAGLVFAQVPAPTATPDRPHLATDVNEALEFLGQWNRVSSGQEFFAGATYVGSNSCGGSGCHDQQLNEWRKTWHSKILRDPTETEDGKSVVVGDFNNATVPFTNVRAVAKGTADSELGKLQNIPVAVQVKTETKDGKFAFVIVDPSDASKNQRYEVAKVVGGKWQQTYHVHPLDKDGKPTEFYFPAPIRWSVRTGRNGDMAGRWEIVNFQPENWVWSDASGGVTPRTHEELPLTRFGEPKCMGCHTTGFSIDKPSGSVHWQMTGQGVGELAVGCERCHGPGSKHVDIAKQKAAAGQKLDPKESYIVHGLKDLSLDQQDQVCGQCHARVGNKDQRDLAFQNKWFVNGTVVPGDRGFLPGDSNIDERSFFWSYSNPTGPGQGLDNFWPDGRGKKSRTQWQDHMGSAHATKGGASCMTCHSFHGDAISKAAQQDARLRQPPTELCEACHNKAGVTKQPNKEMYEGGQNLPSSQHAVQGVRCMDCHMGAVGQRMTKTVPQPTDNKQNGGGEAALTCRFTAP